MNYILFFLSFFILLQTQAQDTTAVLSATSKKDTVTFSNLKFDDFLKLARFENKPYFIVFGASWCAPCRRIKNEIFTNKQVSDLANENFLAFYMDLEDFDDVTINSKIFKVSQLPTVLFFDPIGHRTDAAIGAFNGYYFFRKLRAHIPPSLWGKDWTGSEPANN